MAASKARRPDLVRRASMAPGLPGVWTTALATALVLGLLAVLLWIVVSNAIGWFWPSRVAEVQLADGRVLVGEPSGREPIHGATPGSQTGGDQVQFKVGNRDLGGPDFVWVNEADIVRRSLPDDLVRVVRSEYGDAFGRIVSMSGTDGRVVDHPSIDRVRALLAEGNGLRNERERLTKRSERVRAPLTHAEEALDLVERSARAATPEARARAAQLKQRVDALGQELNPQLEAISKEITGLDARLAAGGLELASGSDTFRVPLGHVLEVLWPNRMGVLARTLHALREAVLFLVTEPREANTEGGIFPALFGTVLLVLLMSLAVVPLGVITAVYMTEYARDGMLLRLANQAVNNLAGVPSIVFGMFGLAFFIYGVGGSIDRAFFADRLPTPTFGTGGILWASLTLALLTVPVVVVATREGLLAVPRSWREGSLALGATQWQTLRRIILPAAMPGILTGLILAVSRAAGEVAPLMLTGAVKLAPSLPVDGTPPFLHLQRKFMHLGFHIYDVSMQSPNVEAAKPMAFATTLVLLVLVVAMNLTAIVIRRRLRRAYRGQAV